MGILITNEGSVTLPCALVILGAPMLAIGKHTCNANTSMNHDNPSLASSSSFCCPSNPLSLMFRKSGDMHVPLQWTIGLIFCYLATLCILIESGALAFLAGNTNTNTNTNTNNDFQTNANSNANKGGAKTKNDMDVETELMASHYHEHEIMVRMQANIVQVAQVSLQGGGISSSSSSSSSKEAFDLNLSLLEDKACMFLNSLAMKVNINMEVGGAGGAAAVQLKLKLKCQEAAYQSLSAFRTSDKVISAAISLLALICKNDTDSPTGTCDVNMTVNQDDHDDGNDDDDVPSSVGVRVRNLYQTKEYGLHVPIQAMRNSLKRAKQRDEQQQKDEKDNKNESDDEHEHEHEHEIIAAELQRKACLYLGALTDQSSSGGNDNSKLETPSESTSTSTNDVDDPTKAKTKTKNIIATTTEIQTKIVQEDGLQAIFEAIHWFRYHNQVVNWGLWAIFVLCLDHSGNKMQFVRLGGVKRVIDAIRVIVDDYRNSSNRDEDEDGGGDVDVDLENESAVREVARHGIAILFDVLRYDNTTPSSASTSSSTSTSNHHNLPKVDFMQVRRLALLAGMHEVVRDAMVEFDNCVEIMMMGQQLLVATGFTGEIPHFDQYQGEGRQQTLSRA